MDPTGDTHPTVVLQDHKAESKVSIACGMTNDEEEEDASIVPLLTNQQDNPQQEEEEEAESKVSIACGMTNGEEEDTSIVPLLTVQQDNPQQEEEEEAKSKVSIACGMTNDEEDASIVPLLTNQQDNPKQEEEEEAVSKVSIVCGMTNDEEEDASIVPLLTDQQDNPQQEEEEEAKSKVSIVCGMTKEEDTSIVPLLTNQQDNPQQEEEEEAESKVSIACGMTNDEEEDASIVPLLTDNPQQEEEEEAESKVNIVCGMTNEEEDASIATLLTGQQDNPQEEEEEESPSCLVLQEDEETHFYYKRMYLEEVAWKLFQDYEKKLHTVHFAGNLHRDRIKESLHHLHQFLIKEEETRIVKQEDSVQSSMKELEARVESLLGLSNTVTDVLIKLEKGRMVLTPEHLKNLKDHLEEMSKFSVARKSHLSPFQVQEWRGIRHIVKPAVKSLHFDPNSANPFLFISPNLKQVRYTSFPQARFAFPFFQPGLFVLGLPGFQCGQHYWEVDVGHKSNWILGIAKDTVPFKGPHNLSIHNGFWVVRKEENNVYYGCDLSTLKLMASPMKIGVFVDVFSGHISFYNADTIELIFEITGCSFSGKLFPIFSPGVPVKEEDLCPLSLC